MAPWPSRLLSPSPRNEMTLAGTSQNPTTSSPSPPRAASRITEANRREQAYTIPSLTPSTHSARAIASSSKTSRPKPHARSFSHPFPALFSLRKKHSADRFEDGYESTDEESATSVVSPDPTSRFAGERERAREEQLIVGKCITCDSTVRWPKGLLLFKCAICLTINDLKPVRLEARRDGHRAPVAVKPDSTGSFASHRNVQISVEKTRQIIDKCIQTYSSYRLKHHEIRLLARGSNLTSPPIISQVSREAVLEQQWIGDLFTPTPPTYLPDCPIYSPEEYFSSKSTTSGPDDPSHYLSSSLEDRFHAAPGLYEKDGNLPGQSGDEINQREYDTRPHDVPQSSEGGPEAGARQQRANLVKSIFRPLEDYIVTCLASFECVNSSFSTLRPSTTSRTCERTRGMARSMYNESRGYDNVLSEMDAKTLLIGDFAENGSWWTGNSAESNRSDRSRKARDATNARSDLVSVKSPLIEWADLHDWYNLVLYPGRGWRKKLENNLVADEGKPLRSLCQQETREIEEEILEAEIHCQRILLKASESLLKRPGRPLSEPDELRFLIILLANPLLYPSYTPKQLRNRSRSRSASRDPQRSPHKMDSLKAPRHSTHRSTTSSQAPSRGSSGQHSGIIKRILGLISNVPNECHHYLVFWFARFSDAQFRRTTELVGSFVTYRLTRQKSLKRDVHQYPSAQLVPTTAGVGRTTSAALHAALGVSGQPSNKPYHKSDTVVYNDDWQIRAAARFMALLFAANNTACTRRIDPSRAAMVVDRAQNAGLAVRDRIHRHGQIVPTSEFYNSLLDCSDLISDFEAWESKRGKFSFCQYPFFLSIWAKIQILEHDARRQMEVKAREAFFDSIMTHRTVNQYLVLKVRRDCLVEDSLKGVGEVVGAGDEEIKKSLRIEFVGEEGVDAGGLRKEWFLLLVRDVFNPEHGMFTYDEDSQYCYFNPNSFETTDQFFLVGVVLGLAIYNSTILDVAFPPFAFRKLLAAGPVSAAGSPSHAKPAITYSLEDLAEFRPALAYGLRQLLEFEGDVETTFCRDFVADVYRYGQPIQVPLCHHGETKPITNANRREFVDLYIRYLLDTAVARQFEPFKRGFFSVCGGNALSLFRPDEIELLIRGSDEPLDIPSLRAVSIYDGWKGPSPADTEPVIDWFWSSFETSTPRDQRKLLSFITGSDRIPGMGAASLIIKVACLGSDTARFPQARTCFNQVAMPRYESRERLEAMLWRAVNDSEGFGLK